MPCAYVRIVGSGRAYQGTCLVRGVIVNPDTGGDYTDIYDGLDSVSGEVVCRLKTAAKTTASFMLSCGVLFSRGVYVGGSDSAVETTVFFEPVDV